MALVSEHSCSLFPANVPVPRRAAIRRRPKLLPPKNKCYTRARINLNQVWPYLDKGQPEMATLSTPLQSCSNFNSNNQLRQRHQSITTSRNLQGKDLINYTLDNIEKLSNFNHIPSKHENDRSDIESVPSDVQETLLQNQIHFYTSCSNINFKRAFEEASQQVSYSPAQSRQHDSHYLITELNREFPKITLEELTDVLVECESEVYPTNDNELRSVKRTSQEDCANQNNTGFFEHKVAARQQYFNVHFMACLEQQQHHHPNDSIENGKENISKNFRRDFLSSGDAAPSSTTTTDVVPSLHHPPNLLHFR